MFINCSLCNCCLKFLLKFRNDLMIKIGFDISKGLSGILSLDFEIREFVIT